MSYNFDYDIITKESELDALCIELGKCQVGNPLHPNVLDVETFPTENTPIMPIGKGKFEAKANDRFTVGLAGVSLSWGLNKAAYIPINHLDGNNLRFDRIVDSAEVELFRKLQPYTSQWEWANHMERYDWGICKQRGVHINYRYCSYVEALCTGRFFDLFRGDQGGSDAGLKNIVLYEFGYQMKNMDELAKYSDGYHIERVSAETAAWYACDDANWARQLHQKLYPEVKDMFLFQVEMQVSHLTEIMEENGIPFKPDFCNKQLKHLQQFAPISREVILAQVERQLGKRVLFDISNPNHTRDILFEAEPGVKRSMPAEYCLKLPVQKRSRKTNKASTDAKSLDKMAKDFEIIHNILTHRKLDKAEDSFLSTLPAYIHPQTGCIHATFHQGGVPSGRFASSGPNAQNLSDEKEYIIKDSTGVVYNWLQTPEGEFAKEFVTKIEHGTHKVEVGLHINVRNCIEVESDELLLAADYRQVEFWGACELACELGMLSMIEQGHDPHTATASLMWNLLIDQVSKEYRHKGKTRNFAMLFGETDEGAAYKEGIPVEEIRELRRRHERALAKVIQDRNDTIKYARKNGCIFTHFGRKVDLTQLYDHPDRKVHEKADRLAYNAKIQGSFTGDLPKIAMARCMKMMRSDFENYPYCHSAVKIPLIHNGHDALMFRLTPKVRGDLSTVDLPRFVMQLRAAMEIHLTGFRLPAKVDITVGHRYGSMHTIHDRTKVYSGQSYEDIMEYVNGKDNDKPVQVSNGAASNGHGFHTNGTGLQYNGNGLHVNGNGHSNGNGNGHSSSGKSSTIKLHLLTPPTTEQAVALKGLLVQYPGNNIVALDFISERGPQSVVIGKFPTCLSLSDADKFGLVLPCKVLVDKAEEHFDYMATAMNTI